jgi:hypothetical protein
VPTKRTRRTRSRRANISALAWRFLTDTSTPADCQTFEHFFLHGNRYNRAGSNAESLWLSAADEIVTAWIKEHPGTRPACWWRYSAPRTPDQTGAHRFPRVETRLVLSGHAVNAHATAGAYGVPQLHMRRRRLPVPLVESQAAYLQRHGLLTASETSRLTDADFRPETLAGGRCIQPAHKVGTNADQSLR